MARELIVPPEVPKEFRDYDPGFGRGYRIGNAQMVPAGAGVLDSNPILLTNHGRASTVGRWKISFGVKDPLGLDTSKSGAGLRFLVRARMENDDIPRTCFVDLGGGQCIYAPGRSINVIALNPSDIDLEAHWNIDEVTAGLGLWEDSQTFAGATALTAETPIDVPTFCGRFEVFTVSGDPPLVLTAYANGGAVVYSEPLSVPRSGTITRIPGVDFTLTPPGGGPQNAIVSFSCDG